MTIVAVVLIVAATVAIGFWLDARYGVKPDQLAAGKPKLVRAGETPATAIRTKPAQLERLRTTQRCPACRANMTAADDEAIRYDERRLIVLHFACPDCGRKRSLYVEPSA
jgi:hypothetical protein